MKQADIDKLCAALESGEYRQGTGALRRDAPDGGYTWCVLGVTVDVLTDVEWRRRWRSSVYVGTGTLLWGFPTNATLMAIGMNESTAGDLADKNDGGWTFPEIAQWIRENIKGEDS